jgi:hypothetical protein
VAFEDSGEPPGVGQTCLLAAMQRSICWARASAWA